MRTVLSFIVVLLLAAVAFGQEEALSEQLPPPGITPDNPLYFLDGFLEVAGDDTEKTLAYKEEKIAEALAMAREGKEEEAKIALMKMLAYNDILQKEISPETKLRIELYLEALAQISATTALDTSPYAAQENEIQLAAGVATKIKQLCETLSQLDPAQYATNCKTAIDSPKWQKELDQTLTQEQEEQTRVFSAKMKQCIQAPEQCDCTGTGVKSFETLCIQASAREAACRSGDLVACQGGGEVAMEELKKTIPAYLIANLKDIAEEYHKGALANHPMDENTLLQPCVDQGITGVEECRKYMEENFVAIYTKENEPAPEGYETFESDEDFLERCSQQMPMEQCQQMLTQQDGKGLAGQAIEYPSYPSGPSPVYQSVYQFDFDCSAMQDLSKKARCFEEFYNEAKREVDPGWVPSPPPTATPPPDFSIYAQQWQNAQSDEERRAIKEELRQAMIRQGYDSGSIQIQGDDGNFIVDYQDNGQTYRNEYSQGTVVYDGYVPESTAEQGSTESLPQTTEQTVESGAVGQTQEGTINSEGTMVFPEGTSPEEAWEQTYPSGGSNDITGGVVGTQEDSFAWRVAGWVRKYMGI